MKKQISDRTRNVPPRSRDALATDSDSTIRNRYNVEHELTPTKPIPREDGEDEISVAGGEVLEVHLRTVQESFSVMPPEPVAILAA